uniref:Uncharacterized protein n=1 Tax=Steinernema glaseri TaxID=37863 RepID=A0A1I7YG51_9BILA
MPRYTPCRKQHRGEHNKISRRLMRMMAYVAPRSSEQILAARGNRTMYSKWLLVNCPWIGETANEETVGGCDRFEVNDSVPRVQMDCGGLRSVQRRVVTDSEWITRITAIEDDARRVSGIRATTNAPPAGHLLLELPPPCATVIERSASLSLKKAKRLSPPT